jgi:predicted Zn-dependent peptidase
VSVFASEYSQAGFYEVTYYKLQNGMHVILKSRHLAHNVSIRLNVNYGYNHSPCGKREAAHFLEHLLFTGTSKHSQNELDHIIESHGGNWNAETASEYTLYKVDIYNKNLDVGMNILHEIMTDSLISKENVEKSRNIIRREAGGKPGKLRNWLHLNGFIASASTMAMRDLFPGASFHCAALDNALSVSREDILEAYKNYYIPQNMTLSLVGDFDIDNAKKLIDETMGLIMVRDSENRYALTTPAVNANIDETKVSRGQFSSLLGTESSVYQIFHIPGKYHEDKYVFDVLEEYFYRELFKLLRVKMV